MHFGLLANLAGPDLVIILVVVALLLIAAPKIPKMARSLGSAQKEFKKGLEEGAEDGDGTAKDTASKIEAAPPAAVSPPAPAAAPAVQAPPPVEGPTGPSS